jgi:hypothetical protein
VADPEDLVTVALNVTGLPITDGLGEEVSAVVVAIRVTTWDTVLDVLARYVVLPP